MSTLTRPRRAARPANAQTEPITFDQYVARDDERKADLIDGYLHYDDMPTIQHEDLFAFLLMILRGYARKKDLGLVLGSRTKVRVAGREGYEPDILFVRSERSHVVGRLHLSEAPDLAVEIVSPSSAVRDYRTKRAGYEQIGTREYWIVDPQQQEARFFRLADDGLFAEVTPAEGIYESRALPGFRVDPGVLFGAELPDELELLAELLG
jgi:Uma2 family endonuclease